MSNQVLAPVLKNKNWRFLLREFLASELARPMLGRVSQQQMLHCLIAPVAVAYAIAHFSTELSEREELNVLIAGAEFMDAFDRGAWYQVIGWLLGNPSMKVNVALVGNELGTVDGATLPPHLAKNDFTPESLKQAIWHKGNLESFFVGYPEHTQFDVAFFPNPGFSAHVEWFKDGCLDRVYESGALMIASAFEESEIPDDTWVANLSGFGISKEGVKQNPFSMLSWVESTGQNKRYLEASEGNDWGSALWKIDRVEKTHVIWREPLLNAAESIHEMACGLMEEYGREGAVVFQREMSHVGKSFQASALNVPEFGSANDFTFVTLRNGLVVSLGDGRVYDPEIEVWIDDLRVPMDVLRVYAEISRELESHLPRLIWATWIYEEFVGDEEEYEDETSPFEVPSSGLDGVLGDLAKMFGERKRKVTGKEVPVIAALKERNYDKARKLIEADPTLALAKDEESLPCLHYAAHGDDASFAHFLLKMPSVNVDATDGEGWNALMYASSLDATDVLKVLLPHTSDINAMNPMGWNALLIAFSHSRFESAELLIRAGANVKDKSHLGMSVEQFMASVPNLPPSLVAAYRAVV